MNAEQQIREALSDLADEATRQTTARFPAPFSGGEFAEAMARINAAYELGRDEVDRLVAERDEAIELARSHNQARLDEEIRAAAAEGREARLREALAAYRSALRSGEPESDALREMADRALAAAVPPADETAPEGAPPSYELDERNLEISEEVRDEGASAEEPADAEACGACGSRHDVKQRGWTDDSSPMPTCAACGAPASPASPASDTEGTVE